MPLQKAPRRMCCAKLNAKLRGVGRRLKGKTPLERAFMRAQLVNQIECFIHDRNAKELVKMLKSRSAKSEVLWQLSLRSSSWLLDGIARGIHKNTHELQELIAAEAYRRTAKPKIRQE